MSIAVIAPGHGHATYDVFTGLCAGLRAHGIPVHAYPLHTAIETMELLVGAAQQIGIAPADGYPDPLLLAAQGIPGFVMAKRAPWAVFVHGLNVPPSVPETLRRGGYKTAVLLTESPYQLADEYAASQAYDVVFTNDRTGPALIPGSVYLPHAYNPAVHTPDGPHADPSDVFFCGTRYPERDALLTAVDWTGIAVCDRSVRYQAGGEVPQPMDNADVAAHYRSARISLNAHRTMAHPQYGGTVTTAESLNPRAYEIPACGGFMVSDARAELGSVFGDSVPTYTDAASLERLIRYYLAHEDARRALAARQHAAVAPHSWTARAGVLLDTLTTAHAARRAA